jgi:glycopeptide antibiotics resistance protein
MTEQRTEKKIFRKVVWFMFFIYLAILLRVIIFKYPLHFTLEAFMDNSLESFMRRLELANITPFKTINLYLTSERLSFNIRATNILANIIAFVPLGFFLPLLKEKLNKYWKIFMISGLLSLFFEVFQLMTGIGAFDIDDIILNTFGAMLGIFMYKRLS